MNSRVYRARLSHRRLQPQEHRFHYQLPIFAIDLQELPRLQAFRRYVSLRSGDYLDGTADPLADKLARLLQAHERDWQLARVVLVTGLRFFGYAFNPVSFWFCYDSRGHLDGVVAEVNNTFGERHVYVLDQPGRCRAAKTFYVSPFNRVEGEYAFELEEPGDRLDLRLRLLVEGSSQLEARLWAERGEPLSWGALLRSRPWQIWWTLPRIQAQAARLYFQKKLPLRPKPNPGHLSTLRADPAPHHRLLLERFTAFLGRAEIGELGWELPDGRALRFGGRLPGAQARMRVLHWDLLVRLAWDGDVGLGDGFVAEEWDSPAPEAVVRFFIDNREALDDRRWLSRLLARLWGRWSQWRRRNHPAGSRRNVAAHYDLGDALYAGFLDPGMSYSCAFYDSPDCDLDQAQRNKIGRLLEWCRLTPEAHLLEIGCGWGALAIEAARRWGCRVTAVTLSQNQWEWTRGQVARAGLQDRVEVLLQDYRSLRGGYDRIVSCEMLEAVGHAHLPEFFATLERLLRPDGLAVLQCIAVPDHEYADYRRSQDWIQKEIFPGGLCPSLAALLQAMQSRSRLGLERLENIGPHYARTLRDWRRRFLDNWDKIAAAGYDDTFRRSWTYYLSYCEAAFSSRNLQTLQLVLSRPRNPTLRAQDPPWLQS